MSYPQYIFYATIFLFVLPSIPFNRMAALVAIVWMLGFISPSVRLFSLIFGCAFSFGLSRNSPQFIVACLYISIVYVAVMDYVGAGDPVFLYWADFSVAMLRNVLLPFGNDWYRVRATVRQGWAGYKNNRTVYQVYWWHRVYNYFTNVDSRQKLLYQIEA